MDLMKTEYEFLDLSDVKEAELCSLQCALFERNPDTPASTASVGWAESALDISSCSSSTAGPPTVSSSLDSLSGGECEMAPHSPVRGAGAGPPHAPPPPYVAPPPAYPPPHHHQWPVAPPNVYVSQVTANVNVHGYMGQYYQPQPQYAPPPQVDRPPRNPRRDRRGKRAPSPPPPQPPPYYVQYPQYYPAAQAQGAPLYHLPMYQPLVYGAYPYPPYYADYPMPVEGDAGDKGPEEYPQEVVMEQEAVDAYYASAHYAGPPYGPPVEGGVEYMPPIYLPPPQHPPPVPMPQPQPPHQSTPHQFNVHAKNFVQGQGQKTFTPPEKSQEQKTSPVTATASATTSVSAASVVEALPVKDLKITGKGPGSPKHTERPVDNTQAKPAMSPSEKSPPAIKPETSKPAWIANENKAPEAASSNQAQTVTKSFPPTASANNQASAPPKVTPSVGKPTKGPAAPFSGGKQTPKPLVPQSIVPVQQAASTPKAPFGNRQKRDGPPNRSPSNETAESTERSTAPEQHIKREPPLPPSKAPVPISITLHCQGQPVIVTNKSPFAHSRKAAAAAPEPPPVPQPPPPAPTASDFPPPPTPRNRGEPIPPPVVQPQPQPAPGKSWASLFSNKTSVAAPAPVPAPAPVEEPASPTTTTPPAAPNVQKPVAKVSPFDASPLQAAVVDKSSPTPRPVTTAAPTISYSEKTSVNAVSNVTSATTATKPAASGPSTPEAREVPIQKEPTPTAPVQPSPFSDDPNSYRMGEFLSKYQLDNRPVSLLPRGLTNRSNYCYVNAILQALVACPPFYNMLKQLPYQTRRGKSSTPVIDSMVELCYEFSANAGAPPARSRGRGEAGPGSGPAVPAGPPLEGGAGLRVLRALRPFPGSQEGRQEDAEEFLGCLLNSLNDEMLELMKLVEPEEPKDANGQQNGVVPQEPPPEEDDDDDEWKVMGPRNRGAVERRWAARRTPVADIFRGRTRLRLHRARAPRPPPHAPHLVTDAVQPFFTLQLDIERANSVKDALELLANKDTLEGVPDAWQQLSLEQLPVVLLLHLKCFQLDAEGHTAKIVKNIDYPVDLKIDPRIMTSKVKYTRIQRIYKLFAVVYHEGVEAVKGHYLTDTYHDQVGWIRYDDSTVTQVGEGAVLKPKPPRMPYLLMYRRSDTLPHRAPVKPE
ncbi:proline-rich extensin-like protein EPR1 isoform X2 [Ostrinia furnacalis]|uniref:proline-rich extensin-like protein EPR1 isoform X1 n=2 Tax=Ostrinia furnacalis TaxID=93504 RepID=UPI001039EE76|nr:proline-rich extensin-like protein EPR1 isoform X1 [Ostrinia furnacalis]XP_028168549.1 proline-rich extensin-like protein EPR1 isoform X2 [Ostrinia furnacalis]XP_028168550.1 proline-rich extensin-like protein EPR1 isoform X2 [Ostrinia furnacalis]